MRRGLIDWSENEVPKTVLAARRDRLRERMRGNGLDAVLVYTNITRPSGVSYLTHFVPYWSQGLLLVPLCGEPTLIVALSKRVSGWIKSTADLQEVIATPAVGATAARAFKALGATARKLGIVEQDRLPADLARPLYSALGDVHVEDATAILDEIRSPVDDAEVNLARHAKSIADSALRLAHDANSSTTAALTAAIEREARRLGAEEIYIALAPDLESGTRLRRMEGDAPLGSRYACRISLAYKGTWIRLTRTLCAEPEDRRTAETLERWLAQALPNVGHVADVRSELQAQLGNLEGLVLEGCAAETPRGTLPLAPVEAVARGRLIHLDMQLRYRARSWRSGEMLHVPGPPAVPASRL